MLQQSSKNSAQLEKLSFKALIKTVLERASLSCDKQLCATIISITKDFKLRGNCFLSVACGEFITRAKKKKTPRVRIELEIVSTARLISFLRTRD